MQPTQLEADTGTGDKSLIPSALAFCVARSNTMILSTASEFVSDFLFMDCDKMRRYQFPEQSPLNHLLIGQIGSNLLQECAKLIGFSAGDANWNRYTRTARKSMIPSVLACSGGPIRDEWF